MKFHPHPYQREAIDHILSNRGAGLFLDMGLGKTVVTLTAIQSLLAACAVTKVLIVAPLRVANSTWPAEVRKWDHLSGLKLSIITGPKAARTAAAGCAAPVHVVNYENLVWLRHAVGKRWPYDMVVFDELSKMKAPGSKRFRAMRGKVGELERVVGLTGTPAPNGLLDLWAQVFLLDGGERLGKTYTGYRNNWFKQYYRGYRWAPLEETPAFVQDAIGDICISMSAEEYLSLPDRVNNTVYACLPAKLEKQYRKLENDMYIELDKGSTQAINSAVLTSKCLQFANGALYLSDDNGHPTQDWEEVHRAKLDALEDIIEESAGAPVLVAYNFKSDRDRILQRFKQARLLGGDKDVSEWNAGKVPLLLAHPASAGHGLNLQDGGSTIAWFGLTWSLENYQQFNARLHRQGQGKPVFVHHIVTKGTVDELVIERLESKRSVQDILMSALAIRQPE